MLGGDAEPDLDAAERWVDGWQSGFEKRAVLVRPRIPVDEPLRCVLR